jgi:hypothetical protein
MSEPLRFVSSLLPTGVMIRLMGPAISVATALCSLAGALGDDGTFGTIR